jgi:drug/metabolite transporter (DMT)-like permease
MGVLLALTTAISWGINPLFARKAMERVDVLTTNFFGILAGLALMLGVSYFTGDLALLPAARPDQLLIFAVVGIVTIILGRTFYYISITRIGAGRSISIVASSILVAPTLALFLLREPLTLKMGVGILLVFAGVFLIARRGE